MTDPITPNRARQASVVAVWLVATISAVLIGVLAAHDAYIEWIAMALGAIVIVTLAIQLAIRRPEGFVSRVTASLVGAVVVLAVATGILFIIAALE